MWMDVPQLKNKVEWQCSDFQEIGCKTNCHQPNHMQRLASQKQHHKNGNPGNVDLGKLLEYATYEPAKVNADSCWSSAAPRCSMELVHVFMSLSY